MRVPTLFFFLMVAACFSAVGAGAPQLNWLQQSSPTTAAIVAIGFDGARFVAVGAGFSLTSFDGTNWTLRAVSGATFSKIAFGNGVWVGVESVSGSSFVSTDGLNWTSYGSSIRPSTDLAFGSGIFVSVGTSGSIMRSPDTGVTWQNAVSPTGNDVKAVTFADAVFLAVDSAGNIIRSVDGSYWTLLSQWAPTYIVFSSLAYHAGTLVLAGGTPTVGGTGIPDYYMARSTNGGNNWVEVLSLVQDGGATLNSVKFGNGRWISTSSFPRIFSSLDGGTTWASQQTGLVNLNLRDIAYGAGTWVAVGANGTILLARDDAAPLLVPSLSIVPSIEIEWQSVIGTRYEVESSTDLTSWQSLGLPFIGGGGTAIFSDRPSGPRKYYRVIVR